MNLLPRLARRVKHSLDPVSEIEDYANTGLDRDRRAPELKRIDETRADFNQTLAHTNTYRLAFTQRGGRIVTAELISPCPHIAPGEEDTTLATITRRLDTYAQSISYRRRIHAILNIGKQETEDVPHVTCYVDLGRLPLPAISRDSPAFHELLVALLASSASLQADRCPIC